MSYSIDRYVSTHTSFYMVGYDIKKVFLTVAVINSLKATELATLIWYFDSYKVLCIKSILK